MIRTTTPTRTMRMTMTTMTTKRRKRGRRITMRMTGRRLVVMMRTRGRILRWRSRWGAGTAAARTAVLTLMHARGRNSCCKEWNSCGGCLSQVKSLEQPLTLCSASAGRNSCQSQEFRTALSTLCKILSTCEPMEAVTCAIFEWS